MSASPAFLLVFEACGIGGARRKDGNLGIALYVTPTTNGGKATSSLDASSPDLAKGLAGRLAVDSGGIKGITEEQLAQTSGPRKN